MRGGGPDRGESGPWKRRGDSSSGAMASPFSQLRWAASRCRNKFTNTPGFPLATQAPFRSIPRSSGMRSL